MQDVPPLNGLPKLGKGSQTVVLARSLTRSHLSRSTRMEWLVASQSSFHPSFPLRGQVISVLQYECWLKTSDRASIPNSSLWRLHCAGCCRMKEVVLCLPQQQLGDQIVFIKAPATSSSFPNCSSSSVRAAL